MRYINKIEESKQKVYNQAVATKILDLIDKLRLNSNENDQRRWVWELMQNAKDVAYEDQPVAINIDFKPEASEPIIEFQHNGKPFSIDNITFLIEQVSTNERNLEAGVKPLKTGKFGTGFMTTHLLSEKAELEGIAKEPELPYKAFNITLDRSGKAIDEIIASVNESLRLLSAIDDKEEFYGFDRQKFNTKFRYYLEKEGLEAAQKGLLDLEISLPYTLAFVPSIQSVSINSQTTYRLLPEVRLEESNIEIFTIQKQEEDDIKEYFIAVLSSDRISIAVEVENINDIITLKEPDHKLPRLFCDFPLIGSEDFNSAVVINSSLFNPTEPRNGIFLSDRSDDKIIENKNLIVEACNLYFKLIEHASSHNWQNMFVLADVSLPKQKEWISRDWILNSFLTPIRNKILSTPMIDNTSYGRIPIDCGGYNGMPAGASVDFPKHPKKEILTKLWDVFNNAYFILPEEVNYQKWSKIIWDEKYNCNLGTIIKILEAKQSLNLLSSTIQKSDDDTIDWLNDYYALLIEEGDFIKDISEQAIYPNQNGIFKKKEELYYESDEIPEDLKDIIYALGDDFREKLLFKGINLQLPASNSCSSSTIANQISKLIKSRLSELIRTEETRKIFKDLYLWFSQNQKEAEDIFDDLYKNKHKLLDDIEIVTSIEKAKILDDFMKIDPGLSVERIQELLRLEELSKGFNTDQQYTPDDIQKRINFENGWKGEAFVYKSLISKKISVFWPNKSEKITENKITDFEGAIHYIEDKMQKYDLVISLPNNVKSFVQVKSTSTDISKADEIAMPISVREWNFINEKTSQDSYYLARVFNVTTSPEVYFMKLEKIGSL